MKSASRPRSSSRAHAVRTHRQAMIVEVAVTYPHLQTLELDFLRTATLFNISRTDFANRARIMSNFLAAIRRGIPSSTRLGLRLPPNRRLLLELGITPSALHGIADYVVAGVDFFGFLASDSEFAWLRAEHGSVDGFLASVGCGEEWRRSLLLRS